MWETQVKGLIVGGTFDSEKGKPSYIISQLALALGWQVINGGHVSDLDYNLKNLLPRDFNVVLWMPHVDNSEDKILPLIKKKFPKMLLIQSKRVIENDYTDNDIVGRMLASHSNLGIKITKEVDRYNYKLLDPLGNSWIDTPSILILAETILSRVEHLLKMKRVGSSSVGDKKTFSIDERFISIIRDYGDQFAKHVNAINPNRLLGNASTRCSKGFPGYRNESGSLFVTRRNVDKQSLTEEDFIEVLPDEDRVKFLGEIKPSVDTPIQIKLFNYYKNVNFMLHGHVYVENGIMTHDKIPCGYLDEFDEIKILVPDANASNFVINLRGHGCLIMANNLEYFSGQTLQSRPFPEM